MLPFRTLSRDLKTAFDTTWLPAVAATMSSVDMIGTPERMSVANVRLKRARHTLVKSGPNTGSLRTSLSFSSLPCFVRRNITSETTTPTVMPNTWPRFARR